MTYLDIYAEGAQMLGLLALGHVGAVYHQPHTGEDLGQRGHGHAADADEVPPLAGLLSTGQNLAYFHLNIAFLRTCGFSRGAL